MCTKSCTPKVEKALRAVPGVVAVDVSLELATAVVTVSGIPNVDAMIAAVNATGKQASMEPNASSGQKASRTVTLAVQGMMCTKSCTPKVDSALRAVPGVLDVQVSLQEQNAVVTGNADVDALVAAVNATGKVASLSTSPALRELTDDLVLGLVSNLQLPGSAEYTKAIKGFAKVTLCPNTDCPCSGLCECGALCNCGTNARTEDQWDEYMATNFAQVEQMAHAALQFSSGCPYVDCECGIDCKCGAECACGHVERTSVEMHQRSVTQIQLGIYPSDESFKEAQNWLAGFSAASGIHRPNLHKEDEDNEDIVFNSLGVVAMDDGAMGTTYLELKGTDGEQQQVTLRVRGMTCASCVSHIEDTLKALPGVSRASVALMTAKVPAALLVCNRVT